MYIDRLADAALLIMRQCTLDRLSKNSFETPRQLYRILASREKVPFLDTAHSEDAVVLLVRDSARLSQHCLRRCRALRTADIPHGVSV